MTHGEPKEGEDKTSTGAAVLGSRPFVARLKKFVGGVILLALIGLGVFVAWQEMAPDILSKGESTSDVSLPSTETALFEPGGINRFPSRETGGHQKEDSQDPLTTDARRDDRVLSSPLVSEVVQRLDPIEKRLGQLENDFSKEHEAIKHRERLMGLFILLKTQVLTGSPFARQLGRFEHTLPASSAVATQAVRDLKALGPLVIWSGERLYLRFVESDFYDQKESTSSQIMDLFKRFLTVRKTNNKGTPAREQVVSQVRQHLERGDIREAYHLLQGLPTPRSRAAQTWLKESRRYLVASEALATLEGVLFKHAT